MSPRAHGNGVRKVCDHGWRQWPKCGCAWYFSYKPRGGGPRYRFSLDVELGRHVESKTEAEQIATAIRSAINAGTFRQTGGVAPASSAQTVSIGVTLDQFAPIYIDRVAKASGKRTWANDAGVLARFRESLGADGRRLGEWSLSAITEDTIEAFFASLGQLGFAVSTRNQYVQVLKASFRWAARKGYLPKSPITDESALKRSKVAQRRRRLLPAEEQTLLAVAGVRLQWLIIAAIETGCRAGALLALQWADVDMDKRTVLVRAVEVGAKKTGRSLMLPMSARLAAVLEMARLDPAAQAYPPTAYVFGELGQQRGSIKKAWETAFLKAHGYVPEWSRKGNSNALSSKSRAQLLTIDLHFHDLRHEAGCRWLEKGWPIHHVQEMLGHANLSQTSTYLHAAERGLQDSMRRFDEPAHGKPVANEDQIEHPPLRHEKSERDGKNRLH
jgi:integrase